MANAILQIIKIMEVQSLWAPFRLPLLCKQLMSCLDKVKMSCISLLLFFFLLALRLRLCLRLSSIHIIVNDCGGCCYCLFRNCNKIMKIWHKYTNIRNMHACMHAWVHVSELEMSIFGKAFNWLKLQFTIQLSTHMHTHTS